MDDRTVIRVEGLWKRYELPFAPALKRAWRTLKNGSDAAAQSDPDADGPWALRGLDFAIKKNESLGIIGRNGAGKSTLLKVLAGVSPPSRGRVEVRGRIFAMIELNAGIHPELTGRENVYLLGAVMGFTRGMIDSRISRIEDFCGIGEWFNRPVRMYSSGMMARLGFAVAMHVEADILLIDEVLAVGDLAFQRQCFARLEELRKNDVTIIFVSHSIRQVERMCDRALMMDKGTIVRDAAAVEVANAYYEFSHEAELAANRGKRPAKREQGTGEIVVRRLSILDENGQEVEKVRMGRSMRVRLELEAKALVEKPIISLGFVTMDMVVVTAISNNDIADRPSFEGLSTFDCYIPETILLPGSYSVRIKIMHGNGALLYSSDYYEDFQIVSEHEQAMNLNMAGLVKLNVEWDSRRIETP